MELTNLAFIDHEQNIVFNPFDLDLTSCKSNSKCDLCKTNHYRRYTYIVKTENNEILQLGKNCLKKLLGYEPKVYSKNDTNSFREDILFGFKGKDLCETKDILKVIIAYTNLKGIDNIKNLHYSDILETKNFVKTLEEVKNINNELLENIINYFEKLNTTNEFTENVRNLVINKYTDIKYFNILKYAYKIYLEFINYKPLMNSKQVDYTETTIKDIQLVKTNYIHYGYNNYANSFIYRIIDTQDNVFDYSTTKDNELDNLKLGTKIKYKIKGFYENKKFGIINKINYVKCF